ncbi:MAG: adenylate/guanylate cyclase domain-containing protein [Pseudomonadota bacterium]
MNRESSAHSSKKALIARAMVVMGVMIGSALFSISPWGRHLDYLFYDALFCLRGPMAPPNEIVVVAVDEPSFAVFQAQWPWSRDYHARLIDTLFEEGARTVAFDILFAEPADPAGDRQLARSLAAHPNTLLAAAVDIIDDPNYQYQSVVTPHKRLLSDKTPIGGINLPSDADGFVRRAFLKYGAIPSLSFGAAHAVSSGKDRERLESLLYSNHPIWINYAGPPRSIQTISYYQAQDPSKHLPKGFLRDKLVFVGLALQTVPELNAPVADYFPFPYSRSDTKLISGVEIHATIAANLLAGNYIKKPAGGLFWVSLVWAIGFFAIIFPRPGPGLAFIGFTITGTALVSYFLFSSENIFFPFVPAVLPLIAGSLSAPFPDLFYLRKEKRHIRSLFSRYVSPKVVKALLEDPKRLRLGGVMVDATVMYLDIADFTSMASRMSPEALVKLLSRYLGRFSDIIFNRDGMVDKYIGDAIMAVWGAPLPQPDHPALACRAALEIMEALKDLQRDETAMAGQTIAVRIGINSGRMLAGNVGGNRFLNYTVHGEATNLAVRLEAINKIYQTRILLGDATAERLGNEFVTREIERICQPGQSATVTLHELVGLASGLDPKIIERCRLFEKARGLYLERRFAEACEEFSRLIALDAADGLSLIFHERCRRYISEPPPDSWDGISEIRLK